MLVAVVEENGDCVYAFVLCCEVNEAEYLQKCEAVEESADRGVVFEDTLSDRPFLLDEPHR